MAVLFWSERGNYMCFLFLGDPRWATVNSHWNEGFVPKHKFAGPGVSNFHLCLREYDWPVSDDNPTCVVVVAFERCVYSKQYRSSRSTSCPWTSSLTAGWAWQTSCGTRTLREIKSCDWRINRDYYSQYMEKPTRCMLRSSEIPMLLIIFGEFQILGQSMGCFG